MKHYLLLKLPTEVKAILVRDTKIKGQERDIAHIYCDGEVKFLYNVYPENIKTVQAIIENFNLFYDNI